MNKFFVVFCLLLFVPGMVAAQDSATTSFPVLVATSTTASTTPGLGVISVSPAIIDENLAIKGIGKYDILVRNNTNRKVDIYPVVNNVTPDGGIQEFTTATGEERRTSLANWISFKRGAISLLPGEEVFVPLKIQTAIEASPGRYYAMISFPEGASRVEAENRMKLESFPRVMINIEITEEVIEKAKLQEFFSDRGVYFSFPIKFRIKIENSGNKKIDPRGSIFIYNRRGAEIREIIIGSGDIGVLPNGNNTLEKSMVDDLGLGKYKAKLVLEYGDVGTRDLQDVIYFWVLPWQMLLVFLAVFLFLILLSTFFLYKKTYIKQ